MGNEYGHVRGLRQQVVQEPKQLCRQGGNKKGHARGVTIRAVETGDEAELDWVAAGHENDRYGRGRRLAAIAEGELVAAITAT